MMKPRVHIANQYVVWMCAAGSVVFTALVLIVLLLIRNQSFLFLETLLPEENRVLEKKISDFPYAAVAVRVQDLSEKNYIVLTQDKKLFLLPKQEQAFLNYLDQKTDTLIEQVMVTRHKKEAISKAHIFSAPQASWAHVYSVMQDLGYNGFTDITLYKAADVGGRP